MYMHFLSKKIKPTGPQGNFFEITGVFDASKQYIVYSC